MSKSAPYTWRSQKGYVSPPTDEARREKAKKAITRSYSNSSEPANVPSKSGYPPFLAAAAAAPPPCGCGYHGSYPLWTGQPAPSPPYLPYAGVSWCPYAPPVTTSESCYTVTDTESSESSDDPDSEVEKEKSEPQAKTIYVRIKEILPKKVPSKKDAAVNKGSLMQPTRAALKCSSAKSSEGLRQGIGVLTTGKPVHMHIISSTSTKLTDIIKKDGERASRFRFRIIKAQDNSTLTQVMDELEAGEGSKVGQLFECGGGLWRKGKLAEYGDANASRKLAELGWSGAGGKDREPVWLYLMRKD